MYLSINLDQTDIKLLLIKIVSILKPRTFREIIFLAWPDNQEANKIVSKLSRTLDYVKNKI